jgi:hypothetical protein
MIDDRGLGRTAAGARMRSVLEIWVTGDENANPSEKKVRIPGCSVSSHSADQARRAENSALAAWPSLEKNHDSPLRRHGPV